MDKRTTIPGSDLWIVTLWLIIACVSQTEAQTINRIDSLVNTAYENYELSGNVLIAKNGSIIYQKSFGYADLAKKKLVGEHTTFQLASVSKKFTSVAILQLMERRKLALDDRVNKYLPALRFENVTIRHLLTHTSGLVDFQVFERPYFADTSNVFSNKDLVAAINDYDKPLLFTPGEKWSYSNSGYGLLALIVEKVSGESFESYLLQHVFQPSGMKHTYIGSTPNVIDDNNRAKGYDYLDYAPWILQRSDSLQRNRIELHNLGGLVGQGNVISTVADLLAFDRALYGTKLLRQSTLQEAFTPTRLTNGEFASTGWKNTAAYYGLGWMILQDSTYGKVVFHTGGISGAVTAFIRNVTRDQTVIVLNNVTHRGTHAIAVNLLTSLNGGLIWKDKISAARVYARQLFKSDRDAALATFNAIKSDTARYYLDEREMNMLGLSMVYNDHQEKGIEMLRLNTLLYPNSANVYDSYAEALLRAGKKQEATLMYKKSVNLNPQNQSGINALKKLQENNNYDCRSPQ